MKLITAIIRPDKLDELIQIVLENGGHRHEGKDQGPWRDVRTA
jgi:nitrogen regulatory protein PII